MGTCALMRAYPSCKHQKATAIVTPGNNFGRMHIPKWKSIYHANKNSLWIKIYICYSSKFRLTEMQKERAMENGADPLSTMRTFNVLWPNNQYAANWNWHVHIHLRMFLMWCTNVVEFAKKNFTYFKINANCIGGGGGVCMCACMSIPAYNHKSMRIYIFIWGFEDLCEFYWNGYDWHNNKCSVEFLRTRSHSHLNIKLCVSRIL